MAGVVVGKVVGLVAVADHEDLNEAKQCAGVAVAGIVLVFDDLFHRTAGIDAEGLQLDLDSRNPVDEEDDVVSMMAVISVDFELVDDLEMVLAPVLEVDQGVVKGGAVLAGERVDVSQGLGGGEDVAGRDLFEKAAELGIGK